MLFAWCLTSSIYERDRQWMGVLGLEMHRFCCMEISACHPTPAPCPLPASLPYLPLPLPPPSLSLLPLHYSFCMPVKGQGQEFSYRARFFLPAKRHARGGCHYCCTHTACGAPGRLFIVSDYSFPRSDGIISCDLLPGHGVVGA